MANDQLYINFLNPVQFVPENPTQDARYHLKQMDKYWYVEQTTGWISRKNYFAPWQLNDTISLQVISDGTNVATATVLNCDGVPQDAFAFNVIATAALQAPLVLLQCSIPLNSFSEGIYYIKLDNGGTKFWISEGLDLKIDHPDTLLYQYWHDTNRQGVVFSEGFQPNMRVASFLSAFNPESKFVEYEDEPANIEMLNGIPYRTWKLNIGRDDGIPDYVIDKINRLTLLNNVWIDDLQISRNSSSKFESTITPGTLKKYWVLEIRPAKAITGTSIHTDPGGAGVTIIYSLNNAAFGSNKNSPQILVQITETS